MLKSKFYAFVAVLVVFGSADGQVVDATAVRRLANHGSHASASYCSGDNILFYNADTGEGAVGKINSDGFQTTKTYPPGAFASSWTHVASVANSVLFYKGGTGDAAIATLDRGDFRTTKTFNNLSRGWTNILYAGPNNNEALFYNSSDGSGALGFAPSQKSYPKGAFAPGWSHIVWNPSGLLFYSRGSGSGAIAAPVVSGTSGVFASPNDLKTTKTFPAGAMSQEWTHVAATESNVLFYSHGTGAAAVGTLSASDFVTDKTYAAGQFSPHWTHIVGAKGNLLLFYNSASGEGAIGEIAGKQFRTTKTYPKGAFARGFTHVACTADATAH
jgi:hypothetical protein